MLYTDSPGGSTDAVARHVSFAQISLVLLYVIGRLLLYLYLYLLLQPLKLGQVDLLAVHGPSNKYARIQTVTTVFPVFVTVVDNGVMTK